MEGGGWGVGEWGSSEECVYSTSEWGSCRFSKGVQYMVYGVWCMVYGVWCMGCVCVRASDSACSQLCWLHACTAMYTDLAYYVATNLAVNSNYYRP